MNTRDPALGPQSLIEARFAAQRIAFGPILFQAARLLRDLGILEALRGAPAGLTLEEVTARVATPRYGVLVLLEAGLAADVVHAEGGRFLLTSIGACLLRDDLTRVNMDFVHHNCFQAVYHLEEAIREGRPAGLRKVFGDWDTVYRALSSLPQATRESWLRWDHYYSDAAFPQALPIVQERAPRRLLDIGGNTGKWALHCAKHDPAMEITILDLPQQLAVARADIAAAGYAARIALQPGDLLDHAQAFPPGFDALWMSQFLVCFAEADVQRLLERAAAAMGPESRLYVLDTFWDRQEHEISSFCLQASSLYFTCLANGASRMYKSTDIAALAQAAGLRLERITGTLGICSSLMVLRRD